MDREILEGLQQSQLSTGYVHQFRIDCAITRAGPIVFPAYGAHPTLKFFRVSQNNADVPLRAPYRQSVLLFPSLHRAHAFAKERSDFLPTAENALRARGVTRIRISILSWRIQVQGYCAQRTLIFKYRILNL